MKKYGFIVIVLVSGLLLACSREDNDLVGGTWNAGPIEKYTITPMNGGATISFDVPNDPGLLYIMAEYERNGKIFSKKASLYNSDLTIEGFNTTDRVKATLYKVNKREQRSAPLEVEFVPLESPIRLAQQSLHLVPGFGGILAQWENPNAVEFGIRLMVKDEQDNLETKEMYFSAIPNDRRAFRGFASKETTFAVSFEDKWGNISDTTWLTTTPFFETLVAKPYADFRSSIPYDNTSEYSAGYVFSRLYDNVVNSTDHGWLTRAGNSGLSFTIDLKQKVKLSRIVVHPYHINSPYSQVNITQFEAWGIDEIDFNKLSDRPYWLDEYSVRNNNILGVDNATVLPARTFKDDWAYLGWYAVTRYDKIIPVDQEAIRNLAQNGSEYEMPLDAPPVRYIRIIAREVAGIMPPPVANYFSMGEITFYGDNNLPQN